MHVQRALLAFIDEEVAARRFKPFPGETLEVTQPGGHNRAPVRRFFAESLEAYPNVDLVFDLNGRQPRRFRVTPASFGVELEFLR